MTGMINELDPRQRLDADYVRIVRAILNELAREFSRLQSGDLAAIHDIRKWLKRFRGLLRLYRPSLGRQFAKLDQGARDIALHLAGMRDLQAMTEALSLLAADEPALLKTAIARRLSKAAGGRPGGEPLRGVIDIDIAAAAFDRFRRMAKRARIADGDFGVVGAGLERTYRRTRDALDTAQLSGSSEDLHVLRRHANYHRQHMRMLGPCWPAVMTVRAEEGSKLHDMLGEEHDLYELSRWAKAVARDGDLRRDANLLVTLAAARRQRLQGEAVSLAAHLFAEKPSRFVRRIKKYWRAATQA